MKLILERADILGALSRVTGVVARNSNIPILNNVLLIAAGKTLTIRATDLDMQAVTSCAADISQAGEITVDAARLKEIANSAAAGSQISLELPDDDPRLLVKSGRSRFRLPVIAPDAFPKIDADKWDFDEDISAGELSEMLVKTLPSVSTEVVRYYLCGVLIHDNGGRLRTVATNGHHLTCRDGPAISGALREIVPTKAVNEIIKALADVQGSVRVRVSASRLIEVETPSQNLRSKVIDGNFPDYERVIPKGNPKSAKLHAESVALAVKRAAIGSDDKIQTVVLELSDGSLTARGRGQGEASDDVEIEYDGEPTTLAFNSSYVMGILSRAGDEVEVTFGGAVDPTTWRDDADGVTVLLPVRHGAE